MSGAEEESANPLRWAFQFSVRTVSTRSSMVMTGYPEESVKSVLGKIAWVTGMPLRELRVIYKGKQLQSEKTLVESGIENDSNLNIVGHLRSGLYPAASRPIDYVLSLLAHVFTSNTRSACAALTTVKVLTMRISTSLVLWSFTQPLMPPPCWLRSTTRHVTQNRAISCVLHNQFHELREHEELAGGSIGAVMEFCKQLRKFGHGDHDYLYLKCRNTLGHLLNTIGVSYDSGSVKKRVSLRNVFSFVPELVDSLLVSLDYSKRCGNTILSITGPSPEEVSDLIIFLAPLRNAIILQKKLLGGSVSGDDEKCSVEKDDDQLLEEEVDYLRLVFIRLLSKMDECFRFIAECLASKESGGRGFVLNYSWSEYLRILKDLYDTSKVFDGAEEMFWTVLRFHKNMLSALVVAFVKRGGDHWWVLDNKGVTNFECRRHLAMILFPAVEEDFDMLHEMLIDRSQVLAESFEYIGRAKPESLRSGLFMEFKNEKATGPGVLREWFVLVSREIFDSRHALFVSCPNDCRRFYPNPASKVHPRHLEYFRFVGRVIALALLERVQVGIVFDRVFFVQLAGIRVSLEDIRDADPCLYRSCKQILEMDADFIDSDALGLTFVRELEELGCREVVELCPGGKNIVFNSQNREHYVDLLIQHCFVTSISEQVANFAQGLADILSSSKLQQFFQYLELEDLDWMLYGSENTISIEDWKAHTVYKDYEESDCQISWFWEIVGRMSAQQRRVLLLFWTSVKYLPVEGFRGLSSPLSICRTAEPSNRLPSSHTCFNRLFLPEYSSIAVMEDHFGVITQEHIASSFGLS
ncbi:LOW QUALITY PROTEIN: E3 ubiquitin-protein ligase UPL5-like [Vigna umbellata]|uniref:LOW QUALITY PROTEIN: E3 ubiquitin-protein ligase UPL5-like n=1 Tax=Vigna umbellata TaxID=87088 RepID=UPI001F5FA055|nr:LOW QUALITY PROTEIN: E3 ubiquitin-protein ligase UPL5-like [Vigna umbellata]